MAYTPMFEKLINTKPERELCLKFLGFLEEKGLLNNDADPEETVAEFFSIGPYTRWTETRLPTI